MNEFVYAGPSRGLVSEGIENRIAELTRLGSHARTATPIYHIHADPPAGRPFTKQERADYWTRLEAELGLKGQPFASAIHIKGGREHEHRAYLRSRTDGTAIRLDHDYARREKIDRITEFERGEPLTRGAHNRAVIAALEMERPEIAEAMRAAGLHEGPRPVARLTPTERLQEQRTGVTKAGVARDVADAWQHSGTGQAFAAALAERGLTLAQGDKSPVVVDGTGNTHAVLRMLAMAAKADKTESPKAAAVLQRLDGMEFPSVDEATAAQGIKADLAPQVPDRGQPTPETTAQASTPEAAQPAAKNTAGEQTAAPAAAETVAQTSTGAPSQDTTGIPKNTAAQSTGGGGVTPSTESPRPTGAALKDIGDGPGDPPGPGATIKQQQDYREKLAAYQERKGQAWAAYIKSLDARRKPETTAPTVKDGGHENADIRKQATPAFGQGNGPGVLALALASIRRAEGRNDPDGHLAVRGNTGDEGPRTASRELSRSDGSTAAGRTADAAPGDGRLPCPGAGRSASVADGSARIARPRIIALAENARVKAGLAACDLSGLRAVRDALRPAAKVVGLQEHREAGAARVTVDRARIAAVLDTHPHPDPADLDPKARERQAERAARAEHTASRAAEAAETATAAKAAFTDRSPFTWMRNVVLGKHTAEQKQAIDAAEYVERNKNTRPDAGILKVARERGRLLAIGARDRTQAWEAKPDVVAALEQDRLNSIVDEAANVGDQTILRVLRQGDPDAARAVILAREEAERSQQEKTERRQDMQRGPGRPQPGTGGRPGPRSPR